MPLRLAFLLLGLAACRIESAAPRGAESAASETEPQGELWVYTSAFPSLVDAIDAMAKRTLPKVNVRWFKAGTEKISSRIEGELAAGGTKADVLLVSDPFLYERYRHDHLLLRYASPNELRIPPSMLDLDGYYTTARISTMVVAFRKSLQDPPRSFAELTDPKWKGRIAIGDPLSSGTAFTWAAFELKALGPDYFRQLRANGAVVAGGNAAVQARIEGGEVAAGVLLLENVLGAQQKGSDLTYRFPDDGAVTIPGYVALFASTRNPVAAKAFYDLLLSPEGQNAVVAPGLMHAPEIHHAGPDHLGDTSWLLDHSRPWTPELVTWGVEKSASIKEAFSEAFSR